MLERPAGHQVTGWLFWYRFTFEGPVVPHLNKPVLDLEIAFFPCHASTSNTSVVLLSYSLYHIISRPRNSFYSKRNEDNGLLKFTGLMHITTQKQQVLQNGKMFYWRHIRYSARGVTTACEVRIFSHTKLLLTMFTAKVRELFHTH